MSRITNSLIKRKGAHCHLKVKYSLEERRQSTLSPFCNISQFCFVIAFAPPSFTLLILPSNCSFVVNLLFNFPCWKDDLAPGAKNKQELPRQLVRAKGAPQPHHVGCWPLHPIVGQKPQGEASRRDDTWIKRGKSVRTSKGVSRDSTKCQREVDFQCYMGQGAQS